MIRRYAMPAQEPGKVMIFEDLKTRVVTLEEFELERSEKEFVIAPSLALCESKNSSPRHTDE